MRFVHVSPLGGSGQQGFSLVELMVAMAISLLLLGGVIAIFVSSRSSYETTDSLSRIQENGRFALDTIIGDIRAAGFGGCARAPKYVGTSLASATDLKWNFMDAPVRGFQFVSAGSYSPAITSTDIPSAAVSSDVLVIRRPEPESQPLRLQADMASSTADFTVPNTTSSGLDANDIALAYSCEAQAYFQVRTFSGGTITHAVGGGSSTAPGNASADVNYTFRTNAEIVPMQTIIYYIRASSTGPAGATSLWRRIGANTPEELVEGVEQMQLRFGVDTNGDEVVDGNYVTANSVADWNDVRSVEVALLVRSINEYGDQDQEAYQLLDVTVAAANDRRMREVFMATASLRNRMRVN